MENNKVGAINFQEFKRGILGILKVLSFESLKAQRLDHYSLYKNMQDIVEKHIIPKDIDLKVFEDEEAWARMILNFPNSEQEVSEL